MLICSAVIFVSCASSSDNKGLSESEISKNPVSTEAAVVNKETRDFIPDSSNVKFLGRSYYDGKVLFMAYSATGAEFNVKAKRLDITLFGDSAATRSTDENSARIAVFVNGERKLDEMIKQSYQSFTVFDGTETVDALVQVLKISESAQSLAGLRTITTDKDGIITPAEDRPCKIEFIGDSITCGYGVDDENRNNHFKTSTEDGTKTYAYKTAAYLNADYSMVSISGWGIVSGYSGNGVKQVNSQLPKYYDKLGFSWGNTLGGVNPRNVDWDFSKFVPDFVVINLGTNDASYTKGDPDKIAEYKTGYVEFLKDIRSKNPAAHIICSLGIMGQDLCQAVEAAAEAYKNETGDEKISVLKFNVQSSADGIAADWHPTEKTHAKAAAKLTAKIKELNKGL